MRLISKHSYCTPLTDSSHFTFHIPQLPASLIQYFPATYNSLPPTYSISIDTLLFLLLFSLSSLLPFAASISSFTSISALLSPQVTCTLQTVVFGESQFRGRMRAPSFSLLSTLSFDKSRSSFCLATQSWPTRYRYCYTWFAGLQSSEFISCLIVALFQYESSPEEQGGHQLSQ